MSQDALSQNPPATRLLAEFASQLGFDAIPAPVIAHAKTCILDALGVSLFGSTLPWSRILVETILEEPSTPQATIWGTPHKVSVSRASLANCAAGHSFELDDLHTNALIHATTLSVPVALALAEHEGGSGRDFLTACVAGFEVGLRVGIAGTHELFHRGFHPQGTSGVFAASAAAGRMMRLDALQMQHALAISGSMASGLMAAQEGAMAKRLQSGHAGQSGAFAAQLARRKYTGVTNAIEAPYGGFLHCYATLSAQEKLTAGLGSTWETANIGFKPYPTVSCVQGPLHLLRDLMRSRGLKADDIARIVVDCSTFTYKHTVWPYRASGLVEAQMNMYYTLATMALSGEVFVDQFTEDLIADPKIMDFTKRIEVRIAPDLDARGPAQRDAVRLTLKTRSGEELCVAKDWRPGSPEDPMSRDDLEAKFRRLSQGRWPAEKVQALLDAVERLETLPELSSIFDNLRA